MDNDPLTNATNGLAAATTALTIVSIVLIVVTVIDILVQLGRLPSWEHPRLAEERRQRAVQRETRDDVLNQIQVNTRQTARAHTGRPPVFDASSIVRYLRPRRE